MAVDQPVEQMANGSQPLLGGGSLVSLALLLDPGGDMERAHLAERSGRRRPRTSRNPAQPRGRRGGYAGYG